MAFIHEHRRRVPTQDHLCRIDVSVFKVAAACADKVRLALAIPTVRTVNKLAASLLFFGARDQPFT
jgi:hypothetical protein